MSETYRGVKYQTQQLSETIPAHTGITELKKWCKTFHNLNLAPPYPGGSYGNLSIRVKPNEKPIIITGTQIGLKCQLPDSAFVTVTDVTNDTNTVLYHGNRLPSSETMLHFALYEQRPDVMCIMHGHSPDILANAKRENIPCTYREESYGTRELVNSALEILTPSLDFFIIKNHGFFSLGKNIDEAGNKALYYLNKCL